MLVFVGHGRSVVGCGLGAWIDRQTVVRMKAAPMPDPVDWGTRTDYVCVRHDMWIDTTKDVEYWAFKVGGQNGPRIRFADYKKWVEWFAGYSGKKPTHGLCAVMCAVEFLQPKQIAVIGFDSIMNPHKIMQARWDRGLSPWTHDQAAEAKAIRDLVPDIIDLANVNHSKLP